MDSITVFPTANAADSLDFLAGGGEMGKLIRSKDWASTPLGSIDSWPQSLRTAVSLCVASNFPISIAWGPLHVQIYNDGYWPICGQKHPESIGQDYKICWASAWPAIGAAFARGWAGEASYIENERIFVDRHGFLEETFFTFSFSPIRDETGAVGGLFHPVTEQTARILSERRVRMLRDLASRAGSVKTTAEFYTRAIETFAEHPFDLPFTLLYGLNELGTDAELIGHTGFDSASPASCDPTMSPARWPIAEALASRAPLRLDGIADRLTPLTCGPYPEPPETAFLLPIFIPGAETATAILIAGVSPRLQLDPAYLDFVGMLGASMSSCVANAWNYENQSKRAELLAELDRAKTTFFSNVSHEFRTPLALILGPLEDLLSAAPGRRPPAETETLKILRRNAERLLKLVNTVLDFSSIEANRSKLFAEPTNLAQATAEHASCFRPVCEKAGLRLRVDCDPALSAVYVDREMWEKITLNLLSNAFKFTLAGEIAVSLKTLPDDRIELAVRDTGCGIPPSDLPNIFKRFTRVAGAHGRSHEGSGIGLALVQELAELLVGSVDVTSELGSFSLFRVVIPLRVAALAPAVDPASPATSARARSFADEASFWLGAADDETPDWEDSETALDAASHATILLADDNADMRAYVTRILTQHGFNVHAAADGQAALETIHKSLLPDLVLTDVMMPRLDGFGLLKQIRADTRFSHLPVIMLSARAGEEANVEGISAGADDYLIKPFSARELVARVEGTLKLARLRKHAAKRERFETVFDASPVALLVVSASGQIKLVNRQAQEIFGYSQAELLDKKVENLLPRRFRPNHPRLRKNFLAEHAFRKMGEGQELFGLRKNGSEVPLEISLNPIDADGDPMVLVTLIDITTRRAIELEKEAQRQELERSNRDLEAFAYIASHDLKAPLRAITHLAEWITEDIAATASAKTLDYLETLKGRTTRLQFLLEGLLSYAQIGRDASTIEEIEISALLTDILALSPPPPGFTVTCLTPAARIRTRQTPLRVVLDNLIANAIKHNDRGAGEVSVAMRHIENAVEFRVSDDGPGIQPQFHQRIFEIFRTLNSRDVVESTGLGLAIVKKMVEVHGGEVRVISAPPLRGASFIFTWREAPP
jgi:PAS domain S-box-containing protein